jgi:hypothetical protein
MAQTSVIANKIREHIGEGATEGVLIALVADLADLFPDMTIEQLSAALHEVTADRRRPKMSNDSSVGRSEKAPPTPPYRPNSDAAG